MQPINSSSEPVRPVQNAELKKEAKPSLKGNVPENEGEEKIVSYSVDMRPFLNLPRVNLQYRLINDGFKPESVKEIFSKKDPETGEYVPKTSAEIAVMQKLYPILVEKYPSEDVIKSIKDTSDFSGLKINGKEISKDDDLFSPESMLRGDMLAILSCVREANFSLVKELLLDDNFDNNFINEAMAGSLDEGKAEYALQTLRFAQETGYNKEFGNALALLMQSASEASMPAIEKIIEEGQEYLIENKEFAYKLAGLMQGAPEIVHQFYVEQDCSLFELSEFVDSLSETEEVREMREMLNEALKKIIEEHKKKEEEGQGE